MLELYDIEWQVGVSSYITLQCFQVHTGKLYDAKFTR